MEIKFKRLSEKAIAPVKAHATDAGFDLTVTNITTELNDCGQLVLVYHTDLALEIPEGYYGAIVPRSSISKKSLRILNSPCTIDAGYRGEVTVKLMSTTDVVPQIYKPGERFAQLIILPVPEVTFVESDVLSETERGEGGYGSTGNGNISAATETENHDAPQIITEDATAGDDQSAPEQAAEQVNGSEQV